VLIAALPLDARVADPVAATAAAQPSRMGATQARGAVLTGAKLTKRAAWQQGALHGKRVLAPEVLLARRKARSLQRFTRCR
jgi:hypothetical protein